MRSPQEIRDRLETQQQGRDRQLLEEVGLGQNIEHLAYFISNTYEEAFMNALRHRPNGELVDNFATLTWLAGSDLKVADMPWLQYGMPRIRLMAKELKLPFVPIGDTSTVLLKAKRMSNGLSCVENCVRCHRGR